MENPQTFCAGNAGPKVRSDCSVSIVPGGSGVHIELKSKVKVMFGDAIVALANEVLAFYGVHDAQVNIDDSGALPFVIAARLEAAIRLMTGSDKEFLLPALSQYNIPTERDRNRFSRLYLPGNSAQLFINAGIHKPDGIILDLEDAVAPDKKYEAAFMVRNALRNVEFYGAERMVRINQVPRGLDDLDFIVPQYVNLILVPKCESADQIRQVNDRIAAIKQKHGINHPIWLMPIIESALGVLKAYEIAASDNVVAMAIGLEDYTADLGARRSLEGRESFVARNMLVMACRAAGIQAIDSVFSDIGDMEGLKMAIMESKSLGFNGMGCIHPRQIRVIHEFYAPDQIEIDKSKKIVLAYDEAISKGLGVVSLGTKMIDPPVVKRALKAIDVAVKTGKLKANWKEEVNNEVR